MKMTPVYNNVMRMLGSIQVGTYIDTQDYIRVTEDLSPIGAYEGPLEVSAFTVSIYDIPKKEIMFRDPWGEVRYHHLVTNCKLPDWFWKNKGCVELDLEHLKRVRW